MVRKNYPEKKLSDVAYDLRKGVTLMKSCIQVMLGIQSHATQEGKRIVSWPRPPGENQSRKP